MKTKIRWRLGPRQAVKADDRLRALKAVVQGSMKIRRKLTSTMFLLPRISAYDHNRSGPSRANQQTCAGLMLGCREFHDDRLADLLVR